MHDRREHTMDGWTMAGSPSPQRVRWGAVFAGVVLSGMTSWVYWALCGALDTAKNEECALQQMDAQTLQDLYTRLEFKHDVDRGQDIK